MSRQRQLVLVAALAVIGCGGGGGGDPIAEAEYRRDPASPALLRALSGDDAALRARAARAMGRIQSAAYAAPLVGAVDDDDRAVRQAAWFALGQLGLAAGVRADEAAVRTARAGLRDADPQIVALAVEALGKLAPPGQADTIAALLDHADATVRAEAAQALLRLRYVPTWRGESDEPPPLTDGAVAALARALGDDDERVRWMAAHTLARYGEPAAAPALAARQHDDNPWARLFAVRGVGRAGAVELAGDIVWGLDDGALHVRAETVASLGALRRSDLIPPRLDSDDSAHVRAAVATALGHGNDAASLHRLRALEADPSGRVREAAILALGQRIGEAYLADLEDHRDDAAYSVRVAAVAAAGGIGAGALELLRQAAADNDARVRTAALEALEPLQDRPAVAELVEAALVSDDLGERATAAGALAESRRDDRLERLQRVYADSPGIDWVEVRETVVDAIANLDGAIDPLRRIAAEDDAPSVRSKARQALARLGEQAPETDDGGALVTTRESFEADPIVVLETKRGEIEIRCFPEQAPVHVTNFVRLVREGFYDGLIWHRVVTNFVVQGGDPLGSGWGGPGYAVPDEINPRRFVRGTVGMPKAGKDTGGCQLFVTHLPTPHLDGNYTVFGQVVSGLDVIDRLEVGDPILRARLR